MNSEEGRSKGFGFVSFEEAEQVRSLTLTNYKLYNFYQSFTV